MSRTIVRWLVSGIHREAELPSMPNWYSEAITASIAIAAASKGHELEVERAVKKPGQSKSSQQQRNTSSGVATVLPVAKTPRQRQQAQRNGKLAHFDADVERQQADDQPVRRQVQLAKHVREAEAVNQSKEKG